MLQLTTPPAQIATKVRHRAKTTLVRLRRSPDFVPLPCLTLAACRILPVATAVPADIAGVGRPGDRGRRRHFGLPTRASAGCGSTRPGWLPGRASSLCHSARSWPSSFSRPMCPAAARPRCCSSACCSFRCISSPARGMPGSESKVGTRSPRIRTSPISHGWPAGGPPFGSMAWRPCRGWC